MVDFPDKTESVTWLMALYGSTMLAVQEMEQAVSFLYAVAAVDPERRSNASSQRQWRDAAQRTWNSFQRGTAGMKVNDAKRGIKDHISAELYSELDAFITGPRNQLAHRFLIEQMPVVEEQGLPALAAAVLELMGAGATAKRLSEQLRKRAEDLRADWPEFTDPPPEFAKAVEAIARMTLRKQFPAELLESKQEPASGEIP